MSLQQIENLFPMVKPVQIVYCGRCGEQCGAVLVPLNNNKRRGRWIHKCCNWKCEASEGNTLQHRSEVVDVD